jgi:hypothetical protein
MDDGKRCCSLLVHSLYNTQRSGCATCGTIRLAELSLIILLLLLLLLLLLIAVWWHVIGCTTFVIMLPAVAPTHQTAEWVFTTFAPDQVYTGISSMPML